MKEFITDMGAQALDFLHTIWQMTLEFLLYADGFILLFIQEHVRTPYLTPAVTFLTKLGNAGMIWIIISALLLLSRKTRKAGCISFLALFCSLLINNVLLKNLIARIRPYEVVQGLVPLVKKPVDFSFPSGHTGSSFASACVLYRTLPAKAGVPAVVLAVLIALSRLYVGVHYPSDVLAGVLTGVISCNLAIWIGDRIFKKM